MLSYGWEPRRGVYIVSSLNNTLSDCVCLVVSARLGVGIYVCVYECVSVCGNNCVGVCRTVCVLPQHGGVLCALRDQ
jgi:hypothetical protein